MLTPSMLTCTKDFDGAMYTAFTTPGCSRKLPCGLIYLDMRIQARTSVLPVHTRS